MRMKASAYKQYGDAAILSLVLEALPQVSISFVRSTDTVLRPGSIQTVCHLAGLIFIYSGSEKGSGAAGD